MFLLFAVAVAVDRPQSAEPQNKSLTTLHTVTLSSQTLHKPPVTDENWHGRFNAREIHLSLYNTT